MSSGRCEVRTRPVRPWRRRFMHRPARFARVRDLCLNASLQCEPENSDFQPPE